MKGIILAAGKGTRLYPLTKAVPKVLLPVYDRPMIYFALEFMKKADISEVVIVVSKENRNIIEEALGDGSEFGLSIEYIVQEYVNGTAGAVIETIDFIKDQDILLYYADNILLDGGMNSTIKKCLENVANGVATLLTMAVDNPEKYGVIEVDEKANIKSIEEKPEYPKSNLISTGIYFFPNDLTKKLDGLELSIRGEYEMTDVVKKYLNEGRLKASKLSDNTLWYDAGNFDSLLEAGNKLKNEFR